MFILLLPTASAGCDGWFWFSTNCEVKPPYCANGECTLEKWVESAKTALGNSITSKPISEYAQDIVKYLMQFISIIAVIYIIYGWFQVMIGWGDEEKVKKAKNIIIYVIAGILIMWLAYGIVKWTLWVINPSWNTAWSWINKTYAYSDSDSDTFNEYRDRLRRSVQDLESELKVHGSVKVQSLQNIKSLVQDAYNRLPDTGTFWSENDTAKRWVDMYIDIAIQNPRSTSAVANAISKIALFMDSAKIRQITGEIIANPTEWNAPLTVSFRANNIVDPSGTTPSSNNYVWWIRENGGYKRELGRWPSLVYQFNNEGTFTVFLDVVSGSRNSKGKIDTLPLSVSKQIEVKPKLGEVTLLLNGVNVTNLSSIKINPSIWKNGIILDATASRAIGKWSITDTTWDFWNGNTITYRWSPIVERQLYTNQWVYTLKLELKSNDGSTFRKEIQVIVRDPSAVIRLDNDIGHVWEEISMSINTLFGASNNVEYSWQIQDDDNKKILKSFVGNTLKYTFKNVWKYIVTLTSRNPNGTMDSDSRIINIESREPVAYIESPRPENNEKPNVFLFDGSKSYDPDTMSRKGLSYTWRLDWEKIELDNQSQDGAKWTYSFNEKGNHTISLTVANIYGKVKTQEKTFDVNSVLDVSLSVNPQVAPLWTPVTFIARSSHADFFEWNFWDNSPLISGDTRVNQHIFKKTGIYDVNLTVRKNGSDETNTIRRKVYVTDTESPYAVIEANNSSSSISEDPDACGWAGAIVVNRSEPTTLDGSKSINVDGTNNDLTYTWNYFWRVKNTASISEKFTDLWCFPIKLTVRSNKTGATHTTVKNLYLKNQAPELTSISTNIDSSKKDSQKLLVRVTANGVKDPDGVVTSYIWYYTTESDKEPQNIQITQKPEITFVLPNITEKYYFGVILEDNDGTRSNSSDSGIDQTPLILDNQNGNIYMPLISLRTGKATVKAGEPLHISVEAKTILGTNITKKAEYAWDFDGDGQFDQKTSDSSIDYTYTNPGTYALKVRVTHNGVSNTKYQTIYVKNELKASLSWYKLSDGRLFLLNTSEWIYDTASWLIGTEIIDAPYSIMIDSEKALNLSGNIGKLTVSANWSELSTADINLDTFTSITSASWMIYQSSPIAVDDIIPINASNQKVLLSLIWNEEWEYRIDSDISIDSDLDGATDNDFDNNGTISSKEWTPFVIDGFEGAKSRTRKVKVTLFKNATPIESKIITLSFNYIKKSSTASSEEMIIPSSSWAISAFDKEKLDDLSEAIRGLSPDNRIILMKDYNTLMENWSDSVTKAQSLINIQESIDSTNESDSIKQKITAIIDELLVGDAKANDEVTIAATLIKSLIPASSENKKVIEEKLDMILAHPGKLEENRSLWKEILTLIEWDTTIDAKYKNHIKSQLQVIIYGWQESVPEKTVSSEESWSAGILGFIGWIVKIFWIIIAIIIFVILGWYILYRITRKNEDIGFQDFLIDSVFHAKRNDEAKGSNDIWGLPQIIQKTEPQEVIKKEVIDPLAQYKETLEKTQESIQSEEKIASQTIDPLSEQSEVITTITEWSLAPLENSQEHHDETSIPDWLKSPGVESTESLEKSSLLVPEAPLEKTTESEENTVSVEENPMSDIYINKSEVLQTEPVSTEEMTNSVELSTKWNEAVPDWLKSTAAEVQNSGIWENTPEETETLPDWLIDSVKNETPAEEILPDTREIREDVTKEDVAVPIQKEGPKAQDTSPSPPVWTENLPDWLK
jgi:PKD repeat protein